MCEITVYLEKDGVKEKLMEDVTRIEIKPDGVTLHKTFEPLQKVRATVHEINSLAHTITLRPLLTVPTLDWIMKRRSIRKYTDETVTDEEIKGLLQMAMAAPSANDVRPWAFVVVRDLAKRQALAETHTWSTMCAQAPVVIGVLGDPSASDHWIEDCSAATENMLLAATAIDLGSVWVAIYPRQEREAWVRQILNIPANLRVLCLLPVGHPAESKPPRTRYEESKVHHETFGSSA